MRGGDIVRYPFCRFRERHNRHRTPKVINKGLDYELLAKNVFLLLKNKDFILAHEDMRD